MLRANCTCPGCDFARTKRNQGVNTFQIPTRKDEFYSEWRENILNVKI